MIVWMLWSGGVNYSSPYPDQAERFSSLHAAVWEFSRRTEHESSYYPGAYPEPVDAGGPSATITFGPQPPGGDFYPDRVLSFGPRGGVRVQRA